MQLRHLLYFYIVVALVALPVTIKAQINVNNQINALLKDKKANVGIAVLKAGEIIYSKGKNIRFPLMSVYKYHVALAVLDKMDSLNTSLDSAIQVKADRLLPDTYSPLRDKYPNRDVVISLGELIRYSVSLSDNNACDILIGYAGGATVVDAYIRNLGITGFHISETEESMHRDRQKLYLNWSSPEEIVRLMYKVDKDSLFALPYKTFLEEIMIATSTGPDKLKGKLPAGVRVGHKTGSSDRTPEGVKAADNDAGFVILPDGKKYYIAVQVMDSQETDSVNASIIAGISQIVYDKVVQTNN